MSRALVLAVGALLLSCVDASPVVSPPKVEPPAQPRSVIRSPARWRMFPSVVGEPRAVLDLGPEQCLVTTEDGQRWLVEKSAAGSTCAGRGRASGSPALEALAFVERTGDRFRFLGDGGTLYSSRTPTGPFESVSRPSEPLARVGARAGVVVGVAPSGEVFRFSGQWERSKTPSEVSAVDLGVSSDGSVLMLSQPETLWLSRDGGASFGPFVGDPPPKIGAYAIGASMTSEPVVIGVSGSLALSEGRLVPTREAVRQEPTLDVRIEPTVGPSVTALREGRAVVDGPSYLEIVEADGGFSLGSAPFGEPQQLEPVPELAGCTTVRLVAERGSVVFLCVRTGEAEPTLELFSRKAGGRSIERGPTLQIASAELLQVSPLHGGALALLGACRPASEPDPAAPSPLACVTRAPLIVRGSTTLVGALKDAELGSLHSPILGRDGKIVYVLGRKRRTNEPAMFVSRDGGRTYRARVIENPNAELGLGEDGELEESPRGDSFYVEPDATLTMDETGALGVRCSTSNGECWLTFDSDGRVANVASPPDPADFLEGQGNRVIAFSARQEQLRAFESLDGGASWAEVALSDGVGDLSALRPAHCSTAGCVFNENLVREGWEGQEERPLAVADSTPFPTFAQPSLGAPIACDVGNDKAETWRVSGRGEERGGVQQWSVTFPRLRDVGRGKTAFSMLGINSKQQVELLHVPAPEVAQKATKRTFFKPASDKAWTVVTARWQLEGHAMVRGVVPMSSGTIDGSKKLSGLDLAWQNQFTGQTVERRLDLDVPWGHALASGSLLRLQHLSVAGGGIFLQPTTAARGTFVTPQGATLLDIPNLRAAVSDRGSVGEPDTIAIGGAPFAISNVTRAPNAEVVLFGPLFEAGKKAEPATTVGVARDDALVGFTYRGSDLAVSVVEPPRTVERGGPRSRLHLLERGGLGAAVALPTLEDLPARPRACSPEEKRETPRSVSAFFSTTGVPFFAATRAPVLVSEAPPPGTSLASMVTTGPVWLLVDGAILHGTPSDPCVAFYRASSTRGGTVAILSGDLSRSWLLKVASGTDGVGVDVKPLSCRRAPDLGVPAEVESRVAQRMPDDGL
jgi:hypothetical protein